MSNDFKKDADVVWPIPGDGKQQEARETTDAPLTPFGEQLNHYTPISVPLAEKSKEELVRIVEMMTEDMNWYVAERNRLIEAAAARQASQPSHASGEPTQQAHQLALDTIDRLQDERDSAFQRGQRAMAEKAAQAADEYCLRNPKWNSYHQDAWMEISRAIRSLAGAEPQNKFDPFVHQVCCHCGHSCAVEEKMKPTEVGSTSEQYRDQGYENLVVNKRIDPTKNWGIAVPDKPSKKKEK